MQEIRLQFPIFQYHPRLVYLDNAATTQKPKIVINGITKFYEEENANIHRGIYELASNATQKYEAVRQQVADFIHANSSKEIIFTSGTTASINLVAFSYLQPKLAVGDEVIISAMEHHANLIPWQILCKSVGAKLRIIPILEDGSLDINTFKKSLSNKTKFVALVHISNTFGTINPIEDIIELAHQKNIPVLIDAAQSISHYELNVNDLDIDFLVFSGHKMYGPTGIGVLYAKQQYLEEMQPINFGGDMIKNVSFEETIFADIPQRFEAGTSNIAGVIGLGYAINFIQSLDLTACRKYLSDLLELATISLSEIESLKIIGTAEKKSAICSFTLDNVHPHDIATFLAAENIAVRTGNHCTQPALDFLKTGATTRASFGIYNAKEDIEKLIFTVKEIHKFFN